jgi:hypothetical protein
LTAYLLLSDYFISSIHPQGMLLGLPKSIWWPIGVRPWLILNLAVSKMSP